ncbi:MAG: DUF11 domain-containing protein [Sedimentisphaerales bacterium]|nr:DUF11 domain-containing protein [Sedimentisphaerales bacterium]
MKNENRKTKQRSHLLVLALTAVVLLGAAPQIGNAKSLYVITKIVNDRRTVPVHAYDIGADGQLTFQTAYDVRYQASGLVGLAVDSDSASLFITFERGNNIQVLDATTMTEVGEVSALGATNLAGIVYDHEKDLLYAVDRRTENLYCYTWDAQTAKLRKINGSPFTLEGAEAYGIALDEVNDRLYVGNLAKEVTVYDTSDWSLVDTISLSGMALSVAVDSTRGYLYTGGGYVMNYYLTQYNLNTGEEKKVQVDPAAGVMGLGVNALTGFVYVTTGVDNDPGGDDLLVYNDALELVQTIEDIGNPTGLAIPGGHTSYNPLSLTKEIVPTPEMEFSNSGLPVINAGQEFTYSICFNRNGYDLTEITLLDTLPQDVTFVRADGENAFGYYDPDRHIYLWENPPLSPGDRTCLNLTVYLNPDTAPGTIFTNRVTIDTKELSPTTVGTDAVAAEGVENVLSISKTAVKIGAVDVAGATPHANPGDQVTYLICFGNNDFVDEIDQVLVTDELPPEAIYVSGEGDGVFGGYDPFTHTYTWAYPWLMPGETECVELVVQLSKNIPPGTTVTNRAVVDSPDAPSKSASADVIVGYNALGLNKSAVVGKADGGVLEFVEPGQEFVYQICFDNLANEYTVHNVAIVDRLPDEVTFVSADGDGSFGEYDQASHTYTWTYPWLSPGATDCVEVVVRLSDAAIPGSVVMNQAVIDSDETPSTTAGAGLTVGDGDGVLRFSKTVVDGIVEDPDHKGRFVVQPGTDVTYALCFENTSDETLTHLLITDTLPEQVSFVTADGDDLFGAYDTKTHTYTWFYGSLASRASVCLELVVHIDEGLGSNVVITNIAAIQGKQVQDPITRQIEVVTDGGGGPGDYVDAQMFVRPSRMYRTTLPDPTCVMTVLYLPEGIGKEDIVDGPLMLTVPGRPDEIMSFSHQVYGTSEQGKVVAYFDKDRFLAAAEGYGEFDIEVSGMFVNGGLFVGKGAIVVLRFGTP